VDAPQPTAIDKTGTSDADMVTTAGGITGSNLSESIVETAVAAKLPAETPPMQVAAPSEPDAVYTDTGEAVRPIETVDECLVPEICTDQYLWSLYQRTPKRDTIKVVVPDAPGQTLYFPVIQECQQGVHRWIEIPTGQQSMRRCSPWC
jgi:hypothetical protein